jgi:hypothetical protein
MLGQMALPARHSRHFLASTAVDILIPPRVPPDRYRRRRSAGAIIPPSGVAAAPQSGAFCISGLSAILIPPRSRPTVV